MEFSLGVPENVDEGSNTTPLVQWLTAICRAARCSPARIQVPNPPTLRNPPEPSHRLFEIVENNTPNPVVGTPVDGVATVRLFGTRASIHVALTAVALVGVGRSISRLLRVRLTLVKFGKPPPPA